MREMEIKVLNINPIDIEKKLVDIGAHKIKNENQINMIFDTRDKFLDKNFNGYARIRISKDLIKNIDKTFLTVKKNIISEKTRQNIEHEMEINDSEKMIQILSDLGYELEHTGEKHRISYEHENILYEIDTWDKETYPYPYMEVEVKNEEDIEKAIINLDLDRKNITTKSIKQLRLELE